MSIPLPVRAVHLTSFFENPVFLSSVSSWSIAQIIKAVIVLLRVHKRSVREILATFAWRTGGMPSSHAALVSSMAASVAFQEGLGANLFAVSFFVALIVLRDAVGVRRAAGLQARLLNILGRNAAEKWEIEFHPVKEVHGHDLLEVVVGVLLGLFIAAAYAWL